MSSPRLAVRRLSRTHRALGSMLRSPDEAAAASTSTTASRRRSPRSSTPPRVSLRIDASAKGSTTPIKSAVRSRTRWRRSFWAMVNAGEAISSRNALPVNAGRPLRGRAPGPPRTRCWHQTRDRLNDSASEARASWASRSIRRPGAATSTTGSASQRPRLRPGRPGRRCAAGRAPRSSRSARGAFPRRAAALVQDADAVAEAFGLLHVVRGVEHGHALGREAPRPRRGSRCGSAGPRPRSARRARGGGVGAASRGRCSAGASCPRSTRPCGRWPGRPAPPSPGPGRPGRPAPGPSAHTACRRTACSPWPASRDRSRSPGGRTRSPTWLRGARRIECPTLEHDLAGVSREQAADDRDRGGLARAVGPEQPVGLAGLDGEPHAVNRGSVPERLPQAFAGEHDVRPHDGQASGSSSWGRRAGRDGFVAYIGANVLAKRWKRRPVSK